MPLSCKTRSEVISICGPGTCGGGTIGGGSAAAAVRAEARGTAAANSAKTTVRVPGISA
jgi:hypothetical protein